MMRFRSKCFAPLIAGTCVFAFSLGGIAQADEIKSEKMAGCVMRRNLPTAVAVAVSVPGSKDEADSLLALNPALVKCGASPTTKLTDDEQALVIGALAHRITRQFRNHSQSWANGRPSDEVLANAMALRTKGYPDSAAMAQCALQLDDVHSIAFVQSRTPNEEAESLVALQPTLAKCLNKDSQLMVTKSRLRAEMERAYVRQVFPDKDQVPISLLSQDLKR